MGRIFYRLRTWRFLTFFPWRILLPWFFMGIAALAFVSIDKTANETAEQGGDDHIIIRTSEGFFPQTLHIRQGESVAFVSRVEGYFWPASDLHPFHNLYPAFDPRRQLGKDEIWTYRFEDPGTFTFHDHLAPKLSGAITVSAENKRIVSPCTEEKTCWRTLLKETLERDGLDAAFDEISRLHEHYEEFAWNCHDFAHDLGFLSYTNYGKDIPFTDKTAYCNGGFYHGYMEGFFNSHSVTEAFEFCEKVRKKFSYEYISAEKHCIHGIGHGSMEYMLQSNPDKWGTELPQLITQALVPCKSITDPILQDTCVGGVYNVASSWLRSSDLLQTYIPESNPLLLCRLTAKDWNLKRCTWEMAKRIIWLIPDNPSEALERIREVAVANGYEIYLPTMIRSVAGHVGQKSLHKKDTDSIMPCRTLLSVPLRRACIRGLADGLFQASATGGSVRSARFCLSAPLTRAERMGCAELVMMTSILSHERNERYELCRMLSGIPMRGEFCYKDPRLISVSLTY